MACAGVEAWLAVSRLTVATSDLLPWSTAMPTGYEYDIFVSYARIDDVPIEGRGWVSTFVDQLKRSLAVRLGRTEILSV